LAGNTANGESGDRINEKEIAMAVVDRADVAEAVEVAETRAVRLRRAARIRTINAEVRVAPAEGATIIVVIAVGKTSIRIAIVTKIEIKFETNRVTRNLLSSTMPNCLKA
jgi:actin-like ATPase involved in cell morphogenesis